jgi:hypothetical protein
MTDYSLGTLVDPAHVFWIGDFAATGHDQILIYDQSRTDWWLGGFFSGEGRWKKRGDTSGFGNLLDGGHPLWVGRFTGGHDQVLFYFVGDGNWWLGTMNPGQLTWTLVDNSAGFGNLLDRQHHIWSGDFRGNGRRQMLFHYTGDRRWWMADLSDDKAQLNWTERGRTQTRQAFQNPHAAWVGRFTGHAQGLMLYDDATRRWKLGGLRGDAQVVRFSEVAPGTPFDGLLSARYHIRVGDFRGTQADQLLVYDSSDGRWWLGTVQAGKLGWSSPGESSGFGNLLDSMHPMWNGDFTEHGREQILFHYGVDGNWWLGEIQADDMNWDLMGSTNAKAAPLPGLRPSFFFHDGGDNSKGFWSARAIVARDATVAGWLVERPGRNNDALADPFFSSEDWHYPIFPDPDYIDATYGKNPGPLAAAKITGNQLEVRLPPAPTLPFCVPGAIPVAADSFLLPGPDWGYLNCELNAWHVGPSIRNDGRINGLGRGPKPPGWIDDPEAIPGGTYSNNAWPWDPRPSRTDPFQAGEYVVMTGTLWQDSGHFGDFPRAQRWVEAYPNHGGWLEIHPVDIIRRAPELEPDVRKHTEILAAVAPPFEQRHEDKTMTHPLPQPPGQRLHYREIIDYRFTRPSTIVPSSRSVEVLDGNRLRARVTVAGLGAPLSAYVAAGTFKATYIMWWAP